MAKFRIKYTIRLTFDILLVLVLLLGAYLRLVGNWGETNTCTPTSASWCGGADIRPVCTPQDELDPRLALTSGAPASK
jgi:hypothetical protein